MTHSTASSARPDTPVGQHASGDALQRLGDAITNLAGDPDYILRSLTEMLLTLRPVSLEGRLSKQQEKFLIESGDFTAEELAATKREVDRGSLQLGAAESFLSHLCATMSLDDAAGFLGMDEDAVRAAVSEGRLYGVEISGRLRLPDWQFDVRQPGKVLPHLPSLIESVSQRWKWQSVAAFMSTPQSNLIAEGRKTPAVWLSDGGSVDDVREIVEASDWW